jgi:hypothetical protein
MARKACFIAMESLFTDSDSFGLVGGFISVAYSGGSKYGKSVDALHYISSSFTETCAGLDFVDSCITLVDDVCRYFKTERLSNFWKLLRENHSPTSLEFQFQYLPTEEREWVCTELTRRTWRIWNSRKAKQQCGGTITDANNQPTPRASSSSLPVGTPKTTGTRVFGDPDLGGASCSRTLDGLTQFSTTFPDPYSRRVESPYSAPLETLDGSGDIRYQGPFGRSIQSRAAYSALTQESDTDSFETVIFN